MLGVGNVTRSWRFSFTNCKVEYTKLSESFLSTSSADLSSHFRQDLDAVIQFCIGFPRPTWFYFHTLG